MSTPRLSAARAKPQATVSCRAGAAAPLQRRAEYRVARLRRDVDDGAEGLDLLRVQPFGIDAVQPIGLHAAHRVAHFAQRVREIEHAALAEHEVDVELVGEALPELERVLVDGAAFVPKVVGAQHRGVAPRVAAADPAFLEHRDVAHAVVFR
jgi:hypothetical protein